MEGSSSPQSNSSPTTASTNTSKYLSNLPSRGLFSSTVLSSNPGGLRVYVCDHNTSPPEDQQIKTNITNILIRSLIKKQKSETSSKDIKDSGARKRGAEKALDGRSKRAMTEGSSNGSPGKNFQSLTVERLRALLKEKGLSLRGKKDELIARLRNG